MKPYYFTFGQKYANEQHPLGSFIHPDGYLVIEADDEESARERMFDLCGNNWSFCYEERPGDYFPRGEIMRVNAFRTDFQARSGCYRCTHRKNLPGDHHSRCNGPFATGDMIRPVSLDPYGVSRGWANWPANFDPVWVMKCACYEPTSKTEQGE